MRSHHKHIIAYAEKFIARHRRKEEIFERLVHSANRDRARRMLSIIPHGESKTRKQLGMTLEDLSLPSVARAPVDFGPPEGRGNPND